MFPPAATPTHLSPPHAMPVRSDTVVVVGVHVTSSVDVNTVEPFVPTTHLPPPHAMHLAGIPTILRWTVHVTPSVDVQIDVAPAAAHNHPFHAIAD